MFEKEVDYRLAKWLLLNMEKDGIITADELRLAWINIVHDVLEKNVSTNLDNIRTLRRLGEPGR